MKSTFLIIICSFLLTIEAIATVGGSWELAHSIEYRPPLLPTVTQPQTQSCKVNGNVTQRWLYHGPLTPIAEVDNQGQVVTRYVYGSQDHVPDYLIMEEAVYRLVTDQLGSVRLVVNAVTGEIAQRLDYDAWGNVLQDTNPGFQPFGFAGGLYDSLTGLIRFGARDYDPQAGRWTAKDPIGFASEDTNLYAYVYNDPVNNVDSSGLLLNLLTGCLISGGIELASQMLIDGKGLSCVDWGNVALEAATGCNPFSKWKKISKVVEGVQCALGNSFVVGTLVHTEQELKPIEEIRVGDKVLSLNERTSETSYQPVMELMQHEGTYQLVKVTLENGEQLEATAGHPFYIQGKGWNVAANLKVGDALQLYNGTTLVVKTVDTSTRFAKVFNFSVAQNANYFVGKDGVAVHNSGCSKKNLPFPKGGPARDPKTSNYLPHPDAEGPHTTLGTRTGRSVTYTQGATFDSKGNFIGRTNVTSHGRGDHTDPHWHPAIGPNSVGPAQPIPFK